MRLITKSNYTAYFILSFLYFGIFSFGQIETLKNEGLKTMAWEIEDDRVMGGRSQGSISFSNQGVLIFSGMLSLENNGGFSSVQTAMMDLDFSDFKGLIIKVKGDGRTYQMWVGTNETYLGKEMAFTSSFPTTQGEWVEVKLPFEELVGRFRGRTLQNKIFNPAKIKRLRFLIGDKKPGSFKLEVESISLY